ncbi:hypothetical protein KC887_00415 [Candidatus Kaiserbacteria bacterium]|nr:hypothetical protein [Candidatus Kaiserbacteria bacterium]
MSEYVSPIASRCRVIDDSNYHTFLSDPGASWYGRGRIARDYEKHPYGSIFGAYDGPIIPRDEWRDRIEEMDRTGTRLSDIVRYHRLKTKNQQQTNFCWGNAPVQALQVIRAKEGQPYVSLSPASICCPITNFRNVGGFGTDALKWLSEHGAVPTELWPDNAIDRRYYTIENKEIALKYRVDEWRELEYRNFDAMMSCLLLRLPVPGGHDWWRHEILHLDPVALPRGRFGTRYWNSWGDNYGEDGMDILDESKATAEDAVVPRTALGFVGDADHLPASNLV